MAKFKKHGRNPIKVINKARSIDMKQAELFLYGKLDLKCNAVGYCDLHKCYLNDRNAHEKRCMKKGCKYFKEVN